MVGNTVISVTQKMIEYFQDDVLRINHALKVFNFAQIIAENLSLDNKTPEIIFYAAILHDIGIKKAEQKYNSSAGRYQEMEGPKIAGQILADLLIPVETINRVCFIIGNHHSYDKIDGTDFQVLVEADFLVNIFEDNMSIKTIKNINKRIFKTESGKKLLTTMYLSD
jgi:uncharacterized protein